MTTLDGSIRLVRFLVLLGSDVEIVVKPRSRATAARGCRSPEILSEICIQISDSLHYGSPVGLPSGRL